MDRAASQGRTDDQDAEQDRGQVGRHGAGTRPSATSLIPAPLAGSLCCEIRVHAHRIRSTGYPSPQPSPRCAGRGGFAATLARGKAPISRSPRCAGRGGLAAALARGKAPISRSPRCAGLAATLAPGKAPISRSPRPGASRGEGQGEGLRRSITELVAFAGDASAACMIARR